ncbi:MAG: tyrosine-type recombinase/integrase [Methylophilaceae bacterium]
MASIRKRSNAWQVRIQRSGNPDISKTFKGRSEALIWARKIESQLDIGISPQRLSLKITLGELLERYRREVTSRKKHSDTESYRIDYWLRHPLSSKYINLVKSVDIAQWRDERVSLGRSPNTLRLELSIISNLYTVANSEWGYEVLSNPTTNIKLPKLPSGRVRRLEANELELITQNTDSPYLNSIVVLALETGMRRGELVAIEWQHINLQNRTLFIPYTKNGETREIPLTKKAVSLLGALKSKPEGLIFDITPHAVSVAFTRACKRAEIDNLRFHDLRHEAISRFFERGLSIAEVATISGHKTWTMLRRYTHLSAANIALKL